MDARTRTAGEEAIRRLDGVIGSGTSATHEEVHEAGICIAAFRNRVIDAHREGEVDRSCLDAANALLSLAYGAEYPLTGFHIHRFEQTREALKALIGGN